MNRIVNSIRALEEAKGELEREFNKHKFVQVKTTTQKRSIISNALQFHWYSELEQQGDMTAGEYRNECKYYIGCAIRAEKDDYFAEKMREIFRRYPIEDRIKMMEFIDITSTFDREQMTRYLNGMKMRYEPQKFVLTNSEDV